MDKVAEIKEKRQEKSQEPSADRVRIERQERMRLQIREEVLKEKLIRKQKEHSKEKKSQQFMTESAR